MQEAEQEERGRIESLHALAGDIEFNLECIQGREDRLLQIVSQLETFVAVCSQSMGAAEESTAAVERTLQVVSERVMEEEAEERWEVERIELLSEDCKKFLGDVKTDGLLKEVEEMAERRPRAHEDWGERRKEVTCHDEDGQFTDGEEEPVPPLRAIESCEVEACGWREQVQQSVKGLEGRKYQSSERTFSELSSGNGHQLAG